MTPLPPGSTIGILGGGQLGRMSALAAARNARGASRYPSFACEPLHHRSSQAPQSSARIPLGPPTTPNL